MNTALEMLITRYFAIPSPRPLEVTVYNDGNNNNNENYNYKTSIAPIPAKKIELSGTPSRGFGQTRSPGTM